VLCLIGTSFSPYISSANEFLGLEPTTEKIPQKHISRYDAKTMQPDFQPADRNARYASALSVLQEAIAAHAFPGCAFGVLANDKILLHSALGRQTYDANSPAITPDTLYDIASVTKVAITTTAAMLLHQRGLLDLEMPLGELLPGFVIGRQPGSLARHVHLHHLLAHSSGLPGYVRFFEHHTTSTGLIRACLELPIEAPPGTRAEYSDPGFILLGKALEVLVHEPLTQWAHREILAPLAMSASCFCPLPAQRAAIPPSEDDTHSNETWSRHRIIQGEVQDENAFVLHGAAGHAGLFSNVPDLLRLAQAILTPGLLWAATTIDLFSRRQPPAGSSRALGWDTPSENSSSGSHFSPHSIGHLGYAGTSLWIDLDARIAIVLLTNRTWPDRQSQLIRTVRPAFHNAIREAL
jgi:serine-type D-Ala-D-Ala carboxypeptidase